MGKRARSAEGETRQRSPSPTSSVIVESKRERKERRRREKADALSRGDETGEAPVEKFKRTQVSARGSRNQHQAGGLLTGCRVGAGPLGRSAFPESFGGRGRGRVQRTPSCSEGGQEVEETRKGWWR